MVDRAALSSRRGATLGSVVAGFIAVLVGYTSSAPIVFEAARALGADSVQIASWMVALGVGMGVLSIGLSLVYRAPIVAAWSTPGAALLATSAANVSYAEAIGAFVVSGALLAVAGFSGALDRLSRYLPASIAGAMLAGVLLRFGLDAFGALATDFGLVAVMLALFAAGRRFWPRYTIPVVLVGALALAAAQGRVASDALSWTLPMPAYTAPEWSVAAIAGLAFPLFIVTMASQNVPGLATLRAAGYPTPASPLVGWPGLATVVLAPFGGFALNLAAITAAICMTPDAHADPRERYRAAVAAGLFYLLLGVAGGTVGALLGAVPHALVVAVAGLALIPTIASALATATRDEGEREAALITFLVTASGLSLAGIGAAFWGLVGGLAMRAVLRRAT